MECEAHGEHKSISIDGTFKPAFTLLGQPSFLSPAAEKANHATPVAEQNYTLLTGLGISGATLLLKMLPSEAAEHICEALSASMTIPQLAITLHIAVDKPSATLFVQLKTICPLLVNLSLCVPHLAFTYESANWQHKSPGSIFLRSILQKVRCIRGPRPNVSTQPVYVGGGTLTAGELSKINRIKECSMPIATATRLRESFDPKAAFVNRGGYMDALAALVVLFPTEINKICPSTGRSRRLVLASSCYPDRLEHHNFHTVGSCQTNPKLFTGIFSKYCFCIVRAIGAPALAAIPLGLASQSLAISWHDFVHVQRSPFLPHIDREGARGFPIRGLRQRGFAQRVERRGLPLRDAP